MGLDAVLTPQGWVVQPIKGGVANIIYDPSSGQAVISGPNGNIPLGKQKTFVGSRLFPGASTITLGASADGWNCYYQVPALSKPTGARLRFRNYDTAQPMVMRGARMTPISAYSGRVNNSGLNAWSSFLQFSGSQEVTVPPGYLNANSGNGRVIPGVSSWSDPIPLIAQDRIDTPGAPFLFRVAAHYDSGAVLPTSLNTNVQGFNNHTLNPGLKVASYSIDTATAISYGIPNAAKLSDLISNGLQVTEDGGVLCVVDIDFIYENSANIKSILVCGDSTFQGQGAPSGVVGAGALMSFLTYGTSKVISASIHAQSGQLHANSISTMARLLQNSDFQYSYFAPYSINSNSLESETAVNLAKSVVMQGIDACLDAGTIPMIQTPVATSGVSAAGIQALDTWVRSLPEFVKKVDLRYLSTPGWTLKPEYDSGDGTHRNLIANRAEQESVIFEINR